MAPKSITNNAARDAGQTNEVIRPAGYFTHALTRKAQPSPHADLHRKRADGPWELLTTCVTFEEVEKYGFTAEEFASVTTAPAPTQNIGTDGDGMMILGQSPAKNITKAFRFPGQVNSVCISTGTAVSPLREGINVVLHYRTDEPLPACAEVFSDDQEEYAEIGLEWDGDTLEGYDGVFEIPRTVIVALQYLGHKVSADLLEDEGAAVVASEHAADLLSRAVSIIENSDGADDHSEWLDEARTALRD